MKVPCLYPNETAICFATGPSLTAEDIELVRPYHEKGMVRTFGCNDSYKVVDFLDVHYACDVYWWEHHGMNCLKTLPPTCHVWTQSQQMAITFKLNHIPGRHEPAFCVKDSGFIHYGDNSGFQLLNLAYHYGIRKFILLGYNMGLVNHKRHFFGDHPGRMNKESPYEKFIIAYNLIQPDIKSVIINCTTNSALNCFKTSTLKEELAKL